MEIYKITKGNFALENTRDIRPHENNLRFHIKIEEKYYEKFCIQQSSETQTRLSEQIFLGCGIKSSI